MQKRRSVAAPVVSAFLLVLVAMLAPGCFQGTMIVPEPGASSCSASRECDLGRICNLETGYCVPSRGPCSPEYPDGDCPLGTECRAGVCVSCEITGECPDTWCECAMDQGCENGVCVPIDPTNSCAPERPTGACTEGRECCGGACCPAGEVCVGGTHCVPNVRPCGPAEPDGYCRDGLACYEGRCVPLEVCLCSSDRLLGCCPNGQDCLDGVCTNVVCSPDEAGTCPLDFVCIGGTCDQLACAPGHPNGECDSTKYCSDVGACIDPGTCGASSDCLDAEFCSTTTICLLRGTCASDGDCEVGQAEDYGQGFECDNGSCLPRETCTVTTDCIPGNFCSVAGRCLAAPDCDGDGDCGTGEYCSAIGQCVSIGICRNDLDCRRDVQTRFCASDDRCYDIGQCLVTTDCPPNEECIRPGAEIGTCEVSGTADTCDSNDLSSSCSEAGGETPLVCCGSGNCCDDLRQRCSAHNHCIPAGTCVNDTDCISGYTICSDFVCVPSPQKPCPCEAGEICGDAQDVMGAWVSGCIPEGRCASNADCAVGEYCDPTFVCRPDATCGHDFLEAGSGAPPNVLVVVDRSGSMNLCGAGDPSLGPCGYDSGLCPTGTCPDPSHVCFGGRCYDVDCTAGAGGSTTTRWTEAYNAIDFVTTSFSARINFGLSLFPLPHRACGSTGCSCDPSTSTCVNDCSVECNWSICLDGGNLDAGTIEVAIDPAADPAAQRTAILSSLSGTAPGGSTPTAPTLRAILANPSHGLAAEDRANAVLLVTDGEATGDTIQLNLCMPPCADATKNGDETEADCGGSCDPCATGKVCESNADCQSHLCRAGTCRGTSCADGIQNNDETSVDCGGSCGRCVDGAGCGSDSDCASGHCVSSVCQSATCADTIKNGDETDVDCGGACVTSASKTCAVGKFCSVDADCASNVCQAGVCRIATCDDMAPNDNETDIDCGGPDCGPCNEGQACAADGDCVTGWCNGGTCAVSLCKNGLLDAGESDIDCGGVDCPACHPYRKCNSSADCAGGAECRALDGSGGGQQDTLVNVAIGRLYSEAPRVRTFVVGVNIGGVSTNLNCHAVYGRTARRDADAGSCPQLTTATCATETTHACYYVADNQSALETAFTDILNEVTACSYDMRSQVFPNPQAVYVYLESKTNPGERTRIERYVSWDLVSIPTKRLEFYGPACDDLKKALVRPIVVLGCPSVGG